MVNAGMKNRSRGNTFTGHLGFRACGLKRLVVTNVVRHHTAKGAALFSTTMGTASFLYRFCRATSTRLTEGTVYPSRCVNIIRVCHTAKGPHCLRLSGGLVSVHKVIRGNASSGRSHVPFHRRCGTVKRTIHSGCLCTNIASICTRAKRSRLVGGLADV